MSLSSRTFRRSIFGLLCLLPAVCAAQPGVPQFLQPIVEYTGGRVTSFVPGSLQGALPSSDILYVNAATVSGASSSVQVGELLSLNQGQGFLNLDVNKITFPNVSNAVAALADFNHDGTLDYAFALTTTTGSNTPNLCVYYGTGAGLGGDAYDGPGQPPTQYPPVGGKSGCLSFPTQGSNPPVFSYIAAPSFQGGQLSQLILEDSANNYLYVFSNNGMTANSGGILTGFTLVSTISIPAADGPGPLYIGDFDHDGNTDLIVNNQTSHAATVYFGNGNGAFQAPLRLAIGGHVNSMLLQDMDGDLVPDLVVENDSGVIQIYKGAYSRTAPFGTVSIGGTATTPDGLSGNGGHLAAIDPISLNIFTTTPIGLSVLQPSAAGSLVYGLKGSYNIGPGRSSYALGQFRSNGGISDLAVDSPEGVAVVLGDTNGDGGFQTSNAYSALAPALGATVAKFRSAAHNPQGYLDVVVNTGAEQGQFLTNNGSGAYTASSVTDPSPPTTSPANNIPSTAWSNILSGDFDGDGNPDLLYSLTGVPSPGLSGQFPIFYIQYGNGDGTFVSPGFSYLSGSTGGSGIGNGYYVQSAAGDFNGDNVGDIAVIDDYAEGTLLGVTGSRTTLTPGSIAAANPSNSAFDQVAAGFFKANRTSKQDLVFQQGSSLIPYVNSGDGVHFTAMAALANAPAGSQLVLGTLMLSDVDGDGNGDVIAVYYDPGYNPASGGPVAANQLYIWWGNGDGTFTATPFAIPLTRNDYLGAVGDMNSDGRPDLVLSDGQILTILYNLGGRSAPFQSDFGTNCTVCSEQHFLAGQGINSISLAPVTGSSKYDVVVANGGVTISNPLALGGATASSIALTPNPDVNTGGITVLANNIVTQPVTGTVVAVPNPVAQAATFTLTATLMSSTGVAEPTGTVEFFIGTSGTPVSGFVPLTQGTTSSTATFTVTAANNTYAPGVYPISVYYGGDTYNSQATIDGAVPLTIGSSATATTLYLCIVNSTNCPATGLVTPPAKPPPWPTMLSMDYGQSFNGVTQASANDGSALSATSTIAFDDAYTGPAAPPANPLCTLPVNVAGAACPPAIGTTVGTSVGVNVFTAVYSGDATHAGSTSIPVTITVSPDITTAQLTSSLNPATQGQSITFTATFTGNFAAPTGSVQFTEAFPPTATLQLLGTATLTPGTGLSSTATFTTSTLPVGTDPITASYAATTDFDAASASLNQIVNPQALPSFTLSVTPTAVTGLVGEGTFLTVTVTAQNGFTQAVTLGCSNLPSEASCIFLGPSITGSGTATLVVSNTAPHTCGTTQPYFVGFGGTGRPLAPLALPALAGLIALFLPGRRRWLRLLAVVAVAAVAVQITGCGNCTDLGTRPGTYTFQVTGSFAGQGTSSPPETQTVPVTLTVTI